MAQMCQNKLYTQGKEELGPKCYNADTILNQCWDANPLEGLVVRHLLVNRYNRGLIPQVCWIGTWIV